MRAPSFVLALALAFALAGGAACGGHSDGTADLPRREAAAPPPILGDATRGEKLVRDFECARCHVVSEGFALERGAQCVGCHAAINAGTVAATPEQKTRWQAKVAELGDAPSLVATGARYRRAWVQGFLLHPHDLRPALRPTMPRLDVSVQQAADIAMFLSLSDDDPTDTVATVLAGADAAEGRRLLDTKGCGVCHKMGGVSALQASALPASVHVDDLGRAFRLAPDLRLSRDRWTPAHLVRWLLHPGQVKADAVMPDLGLTEAEATNLAAYILTTKLAPQELPPIPARLPVLTRRVTYDEVATRVLRKTCWHCHGEPDFERGNGGPGNSGGFGFKGRRLNLSDYESTFAGYLDDSGRRVSVFAPGLDGTPRLVAAMLARQHEEAGEEPEIRGMPLGLPSIAPEDIQVVETWIAQGRPR
jgi:cytochrome c2